MKGIIALILIVLCLLLVLGSIIGFGGGGGGDGESHCMNCGWDSVYKLGYCKTCYKGFVDYTYANWI